MFRLPHVFGLGVLAFALVVGAGISQDVKKEEKKDDKKVEKKEEKKKAKDTLPQFFNKLELTDEQKTKLTELQNSYKPKVGDLAKQVAELNKKIADLKKKELNEAVELLTEAQKKKYEDEIAASKKKKEPDKKKEPEKKKDTDKKPDPDKKTDKQAARTVDAQEAVLQVAVSCRRVEALAYLRNREGV